MQDPFPHIFYVWIKRVVKIKNIYNNNCKNFKTCKIVMPDFVFWHVFQLVNPITSPTNKSEGRHGVEWNNFLNKLWNATGSN